MAKKATNKSSAYPSLNEKDRDFLDLALERLKLGVDATDHNRNTAITCLEFLNGNQWEPEEVARRKRRKRVMLTVNLLPEKVDKVVGDMRQNRAQVKIRPADVKADYEIARIREGMIRGIEYNSNAPAIYDYAGARTLECGEGTWRVHTRYCKTNPFIQEIYLEVIKNSFMVIFDPTAKDHCFADAKWAFVLTRMPKKEFEKTYPKAHYPSDSLKLGKGFSNEFWFDKELITVAEYYVLEPVSTTFCLMEDGDVLVKEEADKLIKEWKERNKNKPAVPLPTPGSLPLPGAVPPPAPMGGLPGGGPTPAMPMPMPAMGGGPPSPPQSIMSLLPQLQQQAPQEPEPKILKEKTVDVEKVKHYVISAVEIIKGPTDVPGAYIPLVKVVGKERNVEGKDYYRGLVHDAIDAQRLVNYWNTSLAELIALAPKSPWMGTAKQFEGYEPDYAAANTENFPFLKYNPDQNAPGPPQRQQPTNPPVALLQMVQIAQKNLDTVIGTGMDLRDVAPNASGKSLIERQKPTELSTFQFVDNLAQAQAHCYKIIDSMIPEVYDTERDVRIIRPDETETYVPINMSAEQALKLIQTNPERYQGMNAAKLRKAILRKGKNSRFNDIGTGKYEVVVTVGPSYATQRQEAADKFTMLAQTNPKLWSIAGDLIVSSLDVHGAEEMAARLRKTLPAGLVSKRPGEPPDPPLPPPPAMVLMMQKTKTELVKQQKEHTKIQVEMLKQKTELIKQLKEVKEGDVELRRKILEILSELHGNQHPADQFMAQQGMGEGEEDMGGMEQ